MHDRQINARRETEDTVARYFEVPAAYRIEEVVEFQGTGYLLG